MRGTERPPWIFAIVGAESTGKSTLAERLAAQLHEATGWRCAWVPEYLREWCEREGRTPAHHEQPDIAAEQARRIDDAGARADIVIADTTPLMTAIYHRQVFGDGSMEPAALQWQRRCRLTLLTALDLPWQADGFIRDGAHVREPVDSLLRHALIGAGLPFVVIGGAGPARVNAAMDAVAPCLRRRDAPAPGLFTRLAERDAAQPAWRWVCESCDVPDCEHASLRLRRAAAR
ncbi:ATP-binding protein [Ideonella sp. DXS29W]|uniref:ATP-binding protein n=1 Tax=Ideonella lacteola TaxID=2984193 RepID=A0ABU9BIR7_9BURK